MDTFHVPKSKINVGTSFYSQGWSGVQPGPNGDGLYQVATGGYSLPNDQNNWFALKKLETTPGWTKHYDSVAHAVSLYNPTLQAFLSYEDENTLTEKPDYVNNNGFGGLML